EFCGINGEPAINKVVGAAAIEKRYDGRGDLSEITYFDTNGTSAPTTTGEKVAKITGLLDARGNTIEKRHLSGDGTPMLCSHGGAIMRFTYDDRNNCIERCFLGPDGHPTPNLQDGAERIVNRFDDAGHIVE